MPLAADEVLLYPRRRRYIFSEAHSHCADTFIEVSRPVGADETITAERINPFPTTIDFGTGKTDTYVNNVAPTARI